MRRTAVLFGLLFACNTDSFTGDDGGADAPFDNVVSGGDGAVGDATGKDVVVPKPHFCQTIDAQFCEDFDIPGEAGAGFLTPNTSGGYQLDFEGATTKSPPFALRAITAPDAGGQANVMAVIAPDAGATNKITLDVDLFVPAYDGGATPTSVFAFTLGVVGAAPFEFGLVHDGQFWRLEDLQSQTGPALSSPIPGNEWVHATLETTLNTTSGSVFLTVTSSQGSATANVGPPIPTIPSAAIPLSVVVGVRAQGAPILPGTFLYDNVQLHWQ